jgi:hypothetical protein
MANTSDDLARDVGLELGIIDEVSDLDAAASEDLKKISRQTHAQLRVSPRICYWDEDDIPDEVYQPLKLYLAAVSGTSFRKVVRDDGLDEAQTRRARLRALSAVAAKRYTGQRVKATYY